MQLEIPNIILETLHSLKGELETDSFHYRTVSV